MYTVHRKVPQRGSVMRILLADRESNVRYGLRVLLEERSEFETVGEAADAEDLLAQIEAAWPDWVLLSCGCQGLRARIWYPLCSVSVTTST